MACRFYNKCPSASGWCKNDQPNKNCVAFILSAYSRLKSLAEAGQCCETCKHLRKIDETKIYKNKYCKMCSETQNLAGWELNI